MSVPEHLWRFPSAAAIDSLAKRFGLPNSPEMQDWPWEVADAERLDEFLDAYESGELCDDERFTLMEMILQSFEDLGRSIGFDARWQCALDALDRNIDLHAYSVWYWSVPESENHNAQWLVTPFLRRILEKHRHHLSHARDRRTVVASDPPETPAPGFVARERTAGVVDQQSLATFIEEMAADFKRHPETWENADLHSFLTALAYWVEGMDGFYRNMGEAVPETPSWSTVAEMLAAAKVYE
ncbi:MAG: hypothetical protein V4850_28520 [Myxococcota bacterium]